MNEHGMKDPELGGTALRGMLERATPDEPLLGPVAANALVAGLKRRRRRRVSGVIGCVVVIAAVAVIVPALTGTRQATPAPAGPTGKATATVYVSDHSSGLVTPISTATNTAGPSIKGGGKLNVAMAATPNGKTVYVLNQASDTVTPISTATNKAGRPIKVAEYPYAITMTPDGKIAYVLNSSSNTVTPAIKVGEYPYAIVIAP
jgi:YVTN family beta-propeller protein